MVQHNQHLSRLLSRILRHSAIKDGFDIDDSGFVDIQQLLSDKKFKNYNLKDIEEVVEKDDKKRFFLKKFPDNRMLIRANQGHSIKQVKTEALLIPILDPKELPVCVHGTNFNSWKKICSSGFLSRMKRNHIHFSAGFPEYMGLSQDQIKNITGMASNDLTPVISGMRRSASVFIFLDVEKAMADGIKFYRSANKVILSPGSHGKIKAEYFKNVVT